MNAYVLVKDFNWFGMVIPKGTLYIQKKDNKDSYKCMSEGNWKPWLDLTFHTLKPEWSDEYFVKINFLLSEETLN